VHRLEPRSKSAPIPEPPPVSSGPTSAELPCNQPHRWHKHQPLVTTDVFIDNLVMLGQGNTKKLHQIRRVLLTTLDEVFWPLEPSNSAHQRELTSVKKLLKGDGYWETCKLILGWILDTIWMTLELPAHRAKQLQEILDLIPCHQKRTSVKKWHKVLGKIRSMVLAIPGMRGLFGLLQEALHYQTNQRLRLSQGVHKCLNHFFGCSPTWPPGLPISTNLSHRPSPSY
jgi:hypothetical protein